jgi:hypothetical protein
MTMSDVSLHIDTYGSAPARYGKGTYKVGLADAYALQSAGWAWLGSGNTYGYVRPPEGVRGPSPQVTIQVPSDEDILALAMAWQASGKRVAGTLAGYLAQYVPASSRIGELYYPDTGSRTVLRSGAANFEVGIGCEWRVSLTWSNGADQAPTWYRRHEHQSPRRHSR